MRRGRRRHFTNHDALWELLNTCKTWPYCVCGNSISRYWKELDELEAKPGTMEQIEFLRMRIFFTLHCIQHKCPDPLYRQKATVEACGQPTTPSAS